MKERRERERERDELAAEEESGRVTWGQGKEEKGEREKREKRLRKKKDQMHLKDSQKFSFLLNLFYLF